MFAQSMIEPQGRIVSLGALRRYFSIIIPANLIWEFAHMPLYTLWKDGSVNEVIFAAVHCMGGDVVIAMVALMLALILTSSGWLNYSKPPQRVIILTVLIGLGYTIFSEWLNIEVRGTCAYSDLMPVVPIIDAGMSPILQWIVIPIAGFWWASYPFRSKGIAQRV
jgi:hypothetical protein